MIFNPYHGIAPHAAFCRRTVVARAVPVGAAPPQQLQHQVQGKLTTAPHISISTAARDVTPEELAALYKSAAPASLQHGSGPRRRQYQHWGAASNAGCVSELEVVLASSIAVAAAFTRDPRVTEDGDGAVLSSGAAMSPAGGVCEWMWRPKRKLVGFARASGDGSLVASIHDVVVLPSVQGLGIGTRLLRSLVSQLAAQGIYDVGTIAPNELQPFFRSCSFDFDHEGSVPMVLMRHDAYWSDARGSSSSSGSRSSNSGSSGGCGGGASGMQLSAASSSMSVEGRAGDGSSSSSSSSSSAQWVLGGACREVGSNRDLRLLLECALQEAEAVAAQRRPLRQVGQLQLTSAAAAAAATAWQERPRALL